MRLILLGTPGVGKGTQALELSECLHILHISTGELLRVEMENKTPIGMKIDKYMNAGELVPDTIIIDMLWNPTHIVIVITCNKARKIS